MIELEKLVEREHRVQSSVCAINCDSADFLWFCITIKKIEFN